MTMPRIAVVGNPNTGKTTLFNMLTGLRQKVGNYPGVTVEQHIGVCLVGEQALELIDVPGCYSLAAQSPDEMVAIDVLTGYNDAHPDPAGVLIVLDASNLRRNLFFASQVLELGIPCVVALNMSDVAKKNGTEINAHGLSDLLGVPVIPVSATHGSGFEDLKSALVDIVKQNGKRSPLNLQPDVSEICKTLANTPALKAAAISEHTLKRALIDHNSQALTRLKQQLDTSSIARIEAERQKLSRNEPAGATEAKLRYQWIDNNLSQLQKKNTQVRQRQSDQIDRWITHPLVGSLGFLLVMATVFQAVFAWATPLMDLIDGATIGFGQWVSQAMPDGALQSLVVDGVIAGVGSVIIFLPQILILFAFILLLEDIGYMSRAAFMMDRLMRWCRLSGQSFIPMLSSFACAVPGIMATRVIPERKDRLATILAAPFMTCSARLPVYALLIAAFVPQHSWLGGLINLQGLVLLGLYLLGIAGGILTAWLLKRSLLRGPTPPFLLELPPYRMPNWRSFLINLSERAKIFLRRAGTIIFTVAIVVWGASYFPRNAELHQAEQTEIKQLATLNLSPAEQAERTQAIENQYAAAHLDQSLLGRAGKAVQPLFAPLHWDWKITAAVLASFPAREVVVAVLGTIYAVGSDIDETDASLISRLKSATHADGSLVFSTGTAIGLLVFYAWCLQCMATIAAIRRETASWRWPIFAWTYMTSLGYLGAWLCVRLFG